MILKGLSHKNVRLLPPNDWSLQIDHQSYERQVTYHLTDTWNDKDVKRLQADPFDCN